LYGSGSWFFSFSEEHKVRHDHNLFNINTGTHVKKQLASFWRITQTVSWKFTVHPVAMLLNTQNSETQNGVTAAESYECVMVLGAEIHD
jgi:hypothetical protein